MPDYRVDIQYPESEMVKSRRRLERAYNFAAVDRVPVLLGIEGRYIYQLPDWSTTLWGKRLEWYIEMRKMTEEVEVRLNGEKIPVVVTIGINADSPFMSAVDLAGTDFYHWLLEAPDESRALLDRITDRYVEVETEYRRILERPLRDGLSYSDDSAQVLSLEQYQQFCVPIGSRLYSTFGWRMMHLCGRNVHLHPALLNDLHITMLSGYGPGNAPAEMLSLAGRVILHGNIDPMLLSRGSGHEIEQETVKILGTGTTLSRGRRFRILRC